MTKHSDRVAVIGRTGKGGYGHWMDQVWKDVGGLDIVGLADDDEKGRAEAAQRAGAARTYADWREMLAKEKPRFVVVGSRWVDAHFETIMGCVEAGAHVYTEKPAVASPLEFDRIIAAAEKKGVKIAVAHHLRYLPEMDRALKMIADGALGDVLEVRCSSKEDVRGGGEDFFVLGVHVIEATRMVLGEAKTCFARVLQDGRPADKRDIREATEPIGPVAGDRIDAMYLGFERVPTAAAYMTSTKGGGNAARFGMRVLGTKGALSIEPGAPEKLFFTDDPGWARAKKVWQPLPCEPDDASKQLAGAPWLQAANLRAARDLIDAAENNRQPRCSVYDARATTEMLLAAYDSHRTGGPVSLPLKEREHPLTRWK
jgi:predicted dehydrogenase